MVKEFKDSMEEMARLREYKNRLKDTINIEEIQQNDCVKNIDRKEQKTNEGVILFFSFDVVNSSLYKTINYFGWSLVLSRLFERIQTKIQQTIVSAELWRLLGDEMIFIVSIQDEDNIFEYINIIYKVLVSVANDLRTGVIFDELQLSQTECNLMKLQNILSLKGAAWIAIVNESNNCGQYDNISAKYQTKTKYDISEFLGNDIDAGFRISKETCDRRLVVSFELAYLLSKRSKSLSNLYIIAYKKLKGVWKEKLYPIIWYYDEEVCNNVSFDESFYYDEIQECSLAKEYFFNNDENEKSLVDKYMFKDTMKAFNKVLKDRDLKDKIEKIYHVIENTSDIKNQYTSFSHLEFHCVAICYDLKNQKILIAKRNENKRNNPGKWEFGCAKADKNEELTQTIISTYEKDFNIKVNPIVDEQREDKQPQPFALYEIKKDDGLHKGIIILAELASEPEKIKNNNTDKYSEVKWIGKEEISQYKKEDGIPDFLVTLNKVFEEINKSK